MALTVGGTPVKSVYVGSTQVREVYVGGALVWQDREVVQITLGTGNQARDQLRAALSTRGMDYQTVTEILFDIELVGTGVTQDMFYGCSSLTSVPAMDTSQVTDMGGMFGGCSSLTSVPAMDTSQVTDMSAMFYGCVVLTHVPDMDTSQVVSMSYMFLDCAALTDGNVRLVGRHPNVNTTGMLSNSGLTREPFYMPDGTPIDVHQVTLTDKLGSGTLHPMVSVTPPAGQTWDVQVTGTMTKAFGTGTSRPRIQIGGTTSVYFSQGATVDITGTITSSSATIALRTSTGTSGREASFTGTVTITRSI